MSEKRSFWKSSLVELTMLGSLTAPLLVSAPVALADSEPQMIYVATGSNGLAAAVGNHYVNGSRPALARAYRALGDPAKVGSSIDINSDLNTVKQTARQSLEAYGTKASNYLADQNLSGQAKQTLMNQVKQVLTVTEANLDQAKSVHQVYVALATGAYGLLATASATTVNQTKTNTSSAATAKNSVGADSQATAVGDNDSQTDQVADSAGADDTTTTNTSSKDSNAELTASMNRLSQTLTKYLQNEKSNTGGDNNSGGNGSTSGNTGNNGNNQSGAVNSDSQSSTDQSSQPGKGRHFDSVQAMIQYLNTQHGKDKLNSVRGATVDTTIKSTHKAVDDYKTIFLDNDGTLFLSKTGYDNIKAGQKVQVTIESVSEGNADNPIGQSIGWYDYTITFSNLQIVNDAPSKSSQSSPAGNSGQQSGNNAGQTSSPAAGQTSSPAAGQTSSPAAGQTSSPASRNGASGVSGNAPTGSVIPQTNRSMINSYLSWLGVMLLTIMTFGWYRRVRK